MKGSRKGPARDQERGDEPAALDGVDEGRERHGRLVPIPSWGPAEGFQLMERFVLKLRNPIFAEMLREALSAGQGVFRRFKDILRKNREIERLWFAFKDKEMRQVVEQWYESERELAGLERLAAGGEPPLELVASDFAIVRGEARHVEPALKLDRKVLGELSAEPGHEVSNRAGLPPLLDPRSLFLAAELSGGEFAGFVWAVEEGPALLRLAQLAVRKHFRGIGLGTQLLRRLIAGSPGMRLPPGAGPAGGARPGPGPPVRGPGLQRGGRGAGVRPRFARMIPTASAKPAAASPCVM